MIEIINAGLYTSIQDAGRPGYRHLGIPVSGALDDYNFALANWLVRNKADSSAMEITLIGPKIKFRENAVIGLAGADLNCKKNDLALSNYASHKIEKGDILKFENAKNGCRGYLAINGGFKSSHFLGSSSVNSMLTIGELKKFENGDLIEFSKNESKFVQRKVQEHLQTTSHSTTAIRFIEGPEKKIIFGEERISDLRNYTVGNKSNRMAVILEGFSKSTRGISEIISSPINVGTMQLLPDNTIAVIMNDGQVTGGFPRIGNIIAADLSKVAQLKPGDVISLHEISLEKSLEMHAYQKKIIKALNNSSD